MLSVYVNTATPMSKDMLLALTRFEGCAVFTKQKTCTEQEVRDFLKAFYSADLVGEFDPSMMVSIPET